MQLTVFENGTCTLSGARSTEDHFICERYKDQIIPSKGKSINIMAPCFCTQEWQQRPCSVPSVRCINYQWGGCSPRPGEIIQTVTWRRISPSLRIHQWIFLLANINNPLVNVGAVRWETLTCNVTEILPGTMIAYEQERGFYGLVETFFQVLHFFLLNSVQTRPEMISLTFN